MSVFTDIRGIIRGIAAIREIPGACGLRTPGDKSDYKGTEILHGTLWDDSGALQIIIEGISQWLTDSNVLNIGTIYGKLNELIAEYNQLRADSIAHGVSTTSSAVDPLP